MIEFRTDTILDSYVLPTTSSLEVIKVLCKNDESILIVLHDESIKKQHICFYKTMINEQQPSTILSLSTAISAQCLSFFNETTSPKIEYIPIKLISSNWYDSKFIPAYKKMTPTQIKSIESKTKSTSLQWPSVLISDPIIVFMGLTSGDCVSYEQDGQMYRRVS